MELEVKDELSGQAGTSSMDETSASSLATNSVKSNNNSDPQNTEVKSTQSTTCDIEDHDSLKSSKGNSSQGPTGSVLAKRHSDDLAYSVLPDAIKKRKVVNIYAKDKGPKMYRIKGSIVTPCLITKNLPEAFEFLPVCGQPKSKADLDDFHNSKIREFVGCDLNDDEFRQLAKYCSPNYLKTGKELQMTSNHPASGLLSSDLYKPLSETIPDGDDTSNLCVVKKYNMRLEKDIGKYYMRRLKYRGIRILPIAEEADESTTDTQEPAEMLQPGKDLIFKIRIYRPFPASPKERQGRSRHSTFSCEITVAGRQALRELRARLVCANDTDVRADLFRRHQPPRLDDLPTAKKLFPSGFLFINNVFYVDTQPGCRDFSEGIRQWASAKGLGDFPHRSMEVPIEEIPLKLGHPEVYIHQGDCEHLFTFAEVRLASPRDSLSLAHYPWVSAVAQHHAVYCTTCAEFSAKWLVSQCEKAPFDPAFFCDTCLKLYLYKDDRPVADFKLYSYRGNEINTLKPQG